MGKMSLLENNFMEGSHHRENQVVEAAALNTVCKTRMPAGGFFVSELRQSASQNLSKRNGAVLTAPFLLARFREADWRNSETNCNACQNLRLNLRRKGLHDLLPLLYSVVIHPIPLYTYIQGRPFGPKH